MNELAIPSTLAGLAIMVIIVIAIVAIVFVVARVAGIQVPQWLIHIGWILLVAFVGILAIKLLMRM